MRSAVADGPLPERMAEAPAPRDCRLVNERGLHARAAGKLVRLVEEYDAEVTLSRDGETVGADSIMELLLLAAPMGSTVTVAAQGGDAEAALHAVCALIENGFDEDTTGAETV